MTKIEDIKRKFTIIKVGNYWEALCKTCFWQGSTKECDGFDLNVYEGDYDDGYCPKCGSNIDELESKYYVIGYLIMHYTVGRIIGFLHKSKQKKLDDKFYQYLANTFQEHEEMI